MTCLLGRTEVEHVRGSDTVLDAGEDEHFRLSATGVWVAPTLIDSWREASQCI